MLFKTLLTTLLTKSYEPLSRGSALRMLRLRVSGRSGHHAPGESDPGLERLNPKTESEERPKT